MGTCGLGETLAPHSTAVEMAQAQADEALTGQAQAQAEGREGKGGRTGQDRTGQARRHTQLHLLHLHLQSSSQAGATVHTRFALIG